MHEMVYWCSRHCKEDVYIVVELVAASKHCSTRTSISGIESPRYVCGWTFFQVDDDEESMKVAPIYEGTPRKLLYVGRTGTSSDALEVFRSALRKSNANLQFVSASFSPAPSTCNTSTSTSTPNALSNVEVRYVKEDYIISAKENIPGIAFDSNKGLLKSVYSNSCALDLTSLSVAFQSLVARDDFEKEVIKSVVGADSSSTKKKGTFLQFSKRHKKKTRQAQADVMILNRRMRFAIHNSHVILESKAVDLRIGENNDLVSDENVRMDHYWKHQLCALVCSLEYTLSVPPGGSVGTKPLSVDSKHSTGTVVAGFQIHVPFDEKGKRCHHQDIVELLLANDERYHDVIPFPEDLMRPDLKPAPLDGIKLKFKHSIVPVSNDSGDSIVETQATNGSLSETNTDEQPSHAESDELVQEEGPPTSTTKGEEHERDGRAEDTHSDSFSEASDNLDQSDQAAAEPKHPPFQLTNSFEVKSSAENSAPSTSIPRGTCERVPTIDKNGRNDDEIKQESSIDTSIDSNCMNDKKQVDVREESKTEERNDPDATDHEPTVHNHQERIQTDHTETETRTSGITVSDLLDEDADGCKLNFRIESLSIKQLQESSVFISFQIFNNPERKIKVLQNKSIGSDGEVKDVHVHEEMFYYCKQNNTNARDELLHYLEVGNICIDIWSSTSMMHIGMVVIPVKEIVRHASGNMFGVERANGLIGESGKIDLGSQGDICGEIEVCLGVENIKRQRGNETAPIDNVNKEGVRYARLLKETDMDLTSFIEDAQEVIVRFRGMERTKGSILQPHSNRLSFFLSLLEHSYDGQEFKVEEIESLIIECYRREHQHDFIRRHVETLDLTQHNTINVTVHAGKASCVQLVLNNSHNARKKFTISVSAPELRALIDGPEADEIVSILPPPIMIGSSSDIKLCTKEVVFPEKIGSGGAYSVWVQGGQCVAVPFILQVFELHPKTKDIILRVEDITNEACAWQAPQQVYRMNVRVRQLPTDKMFHLVGNRDDVLSRVVYPALPFRYMPMKCIYGGESHIDDFTCEADPDIGITIKSKCVDVKTHTADDFALLVFYKDRQMLVPYNCWRFTLYGYEQVAVTTKTRHWNSHILPMKYDASSRGKTFTFHTSDEVHVIINPTTVTPRYGETNEKVKISFNFEREGVYSFIVNMVRNGGVEERGWLFKVKATEQLKHASSAGNEAKQSMGYYD